MKDKVFAVQAFLWALRARMPARGRSAALGLLAALPWSTFDSRDRPDDADRGVSIAYIAQQASVSPRTVHRALHGGGEPEDKAWESWKALPEDKRKLDSLGRPKRPRLDPRLSLVSLGVVEVVTEGRQGRASHYRFNVVRAQELAARAQRKVLNHIDDRDARNEGKRRGTPGYEPPRVPPLPTGEDVANDDLAVPRWLADVDDRVGMFRAIRTIEQELYGPHTSEVAERAAAQRWVGLHEHILALWLQRACPAWDELAAEVVRYTRTTRVCRNRAILTKWRGYVESKDGLGWFKRVNTDWTDPSSLNPSRFLTNKRVSEGLAIADLHDHGGECGCAKDTSEAEPEPEPEDAPGTILASILGNTTDEDAAMIWARIRGGLDPVTAKTWTEPLTATVEDGVFVVDVPNRYYSEYLCELGEFRSLARCAVRFVQRRA